MSIALLPYGYSNTYCLFELFYCIAVSDCASVLSVVLLQLHHAWLRQHVQLLHRAVHTRPGEEQTGPLHPAGGAHSL